MASDLLERLAHDDVPPPPATFDRDVHERVNHTLAALHVIEFGLRVLPYALTHFLRAVGGLIGFSVTGQYRKTKQTTKDGEPE